ncbi:beta-propeller fold lactonase family protein [Paludibaculum fermentans]|uniref:beta-propeller fold lactonase family protein n=1 Tax=Paludibaculum fermentans TaxID=1473598 RepID=UPI003EBB2C92
MYTRFDVVRRSARAVFCVLVFSLMLAMHASASVITFGTYQEFGFTDAGVQATGCDPADPAGPFCIESSGTVIVLLGSVPWTFTAPAGGAVLTVTDAFLSGDRFEIFDFGTSVGLTSVPVDNIDCGDDPVPCLATPGVSSGVFNLAAGNHSLTITPTISNGGGSGYLFVDAPTTSNVPEPDSWVLLCLGLGLIILSRHWPSLHFNRQRRRRMGIPLACLALAAIVRLAWQPVPVHGAGPTLFSGPTSSQPLALTADDAFLVVANPDNNSVSFFDLRQDRNRRLAEVPVQSEPNGVAILPDGSKAYAANTVSGTVTVIPLNLKNGVIFKPSKHIAVGTEPYGLALSPNGRKLYVSNSRSESVSVIDIATDTVTKTIFGVGPEPRGLAITNDGDADDTDETVYVTQFLALPVAGKVDGQDDAKAGHVTVIASSTDTVTGSITINPLADTGFNATGDAIARVAPGDPANPANFTFPTGAYPNQLNNIAVKGGYAFVPSVGASPNGPVRFDVNTHSLLSALDRTTGLDAGQTINMHLAVKNQTAAPKLFNTLPWAIAFKHAANEGYVVIAASNVVIKVSVNPSTGAATVQADPLNSARVLQLPVGKNPRGIVINSTDTRAYVMNFVSRDMTVLNLTGPENPMATVLSAKQPTVGSLAEKVQIGKELYNTSVGTFDPPTLGSPAITGRMSANGWGACATCHPFGHSDNVVWIFPSGPKRTIPQHTDFDLTDPNRASMRPLNWSAERDEQEDFELNIRAVSGGQGLIVLGDGVTQDTAVTNLTPLANGGRNQLKVRGIGAWDALKAYVQYGIRPPISPFSKTEPNAIAGRALFISANCQQCHGGPQWTKAKIRFTPPPAAGLISAGGEISGELRSVGTFNPAALNEVRQNAGAPLGANGFVPPSLLSIFAFPQTFLHNGAAKSLDEVLNNVTHRSAGTSGVDVLSSPADRSKIVDFLKTIDALSTPVP